MIAVGMVSNGMAAATTASTFAAGAFIGSSTVYGMSVITAAATSNSVEDFNAQGNWGTVAGTVGGGVLGGAIAAVSTRSSSSSASNEQQETQSSTQPTRITGYTRHGINNAISRNGVGVKPSAILNTVRDPLRITLQRNGTFRFIGR